MDVNLTISLMRGQMGVVIEKAVNTAVETVLGEMIRVMSLKFEQLRKEMAVKEKESEDIKKMLESSRCQMKVLRQKYVNALNAKDARHTFTPHRPTWGQMNTARNSAAQLDPNKQPATLLDAAAKTHPGASDHVAISRQRISNTASSCADSLKPRNPDPTLAALHVSKTQNVIHDAAHAESCKNADIYNEEELGLKAPLKVENSTSIIPDSIDALWGQTSLDADHTEVDQNLQPIAHSSEALNAAETGCKDSLLKIKQEEAEVSIIEVKEEQPETSTSEFARNDLHQHLAGAGMAIELPVTQQCAQMPSVSEPAFMGVDPNTYKQSKKERSRKYRERINSDPLKKQAELEARRRRYRERKANGEIKSSKLLPMDKRIKLQQNWVESKQRQRRRAKIQNTESQLAVADAQRQMHPFCKDLILYEDYKRKRVEVRQRSETRRRELERALPQALLADLVKERREKTRLRVARWRAKRKLQACLMAQAAQFNNAQALYTGRRRGAASQHGGIGLGTAHSETGVYSIPLQMGTSPLLAAQTLSMSEGQPGPSVFVQQRTSGAGSESYQ